MSKAGRGGKYALGGRTKSEKLNTRTTGGTKRKAQEQPYGTEREFTGVQYKIYNFSGATKRGTDVEAVQIRARSYEEALAQAKLRGLKVGKTSLREEKESKKRGKK